MYCPLNDGQVVAEIQKFSQKTFEEKVQGFRETVQLKGTNDFQNLICTLPVIDINQSDILIFDKVAADYERRHLLDAFWKKHQMQLDKPSIPKPTDRELYFAVAALMQLKAFWDKRHKAEKEEYIISASDAYTGKNLPIKGYRLRNVGIALDDRYTEVSAIIRLGNNVDIRLSDITAFGSRDLEIRDEQHLYELIATTKLSYFSDGSLIAPCIEEEMTVKNHLKDIHWISKDNFYHVIVDSSEALTKLKLNEEGVEARAETVAVSRMLITASAHNIKKTYQLTIKHGLVVDIRYKDQSIFVAYVPQQKFMKK
jgi:hypothetical protein